MASGDIGYDSVVPVNMFSMLASSEAVAVKTRRFPSLTAYAWALYSSWPPFLYWKVITGSTCPLVSVSVPVSELTIIEPHVRV